MAFPIELVLAVVIGFLMAWAVGANDVANAMASTVGSKTLSVQSAVLIAAVFEAVGAIFASGQVTNMIRYGVLDIAAFHEQQDIFILGMLASLLSAATWLLVATYHGWPVSTTHSIIGAVLGFGFVSVGVDNILWGNLRLIFLSWLLTPVCAVCAAYLIFQIISYVVLSAPAPLQRAGKVVPICLMLLVFIFGGVTVFQGIDALGIKVDLWQKYVWVTITAIATYVLVSAYAQKEYIKYQCLGREQQLVIVEKKFGVLSIITAASMAYAHGSNDVANAIGPVAAVAQLVTTQSFTQGASIPVWVVLLGATGIILGLVMYGYRIMETVGTGITQLTPSRGFTAQFATSAIIVSASGFGYPVSTTQTMVGAILGVGLARGMAALNIKVIKNIFISWVITVPMGAILSAGYFYMLRIVIG